MTRLVRAIHAPTRGGGSSKWIPRTSRGMTAYSAYGFRYDVARIVSSAPAGSRANTTPACFDDLRAT